jgi:hypothetical protein
MCRHFKSVDSSSAFHNLETLPQRNKTSFEAYCDMTLNAGSVQSENHRRRRPLLDNGSLGTFPRKRISL